MLLGADIFPNPYGRDTLGVMLFPLGAAMLARALWQGGPKGNQGSAAPLPFPGQGTHQPQAAPGQ